MTALWKNIMVIRYMLRICVVLHISSNFHKGAESALVTKPQDVVAVSGQVVTLNCASSVSRRGNIAWITPYPETFIYANNNTASSVSKYITVDDRDDGSCNLNINASLAAAKRYICKELDSVAEAGAELVVVENNAKCTREIIFGSHIVNCYVVSAGKWNPTVECEEINEAGELSMLQKTWNLVVASHWMFISQKNDPCNIISCSSEFKPTGIPKAKIETDCPRCSFRELELSLRQLFLISRNNTFWTHARLCFQDELRNLPRGYDNAAVFLSWTGFIIPAMALFATFLVSVCTPKQSDSAHSVLLPSLCVALLIVDIIFMAGILGSKQRFR